MINGYLLVRFLEQTVQLPNGEVLHVLEEYALHLLLSFLLALENILQHAQERLRL